MSLTRTAAVIAEKNRPMLQQPYPLSSDTDYIFHPRLKQVPEHARLKSESSNSKNAFSDNFFSPESPHPNTPPAIPSPTHKGTHSDIEKETKLSDASSRAYSYPKISFSSESSPTNTPSPPLSSPKHKRTDSEIENEAQLRACTTLYELVKYAIEALEGFYGYVLNTTQMATIERYPTISTRDKLDSWIQTAVDQKAKMENQKTRCAHFLFCHSQKVDQQNAHKLLHLIGSLLDKPYNTETILYFTTAVGQLGDFFIPPLMRPSPPISP